MVCVCVCVVTMPATAATMNGADPTSSWYSTVYIQLDDHSVITTGRLPAACLVLTSEPTVPGSWPCDQKRSAQNRPIVYEQ